MIALQHAWSQSCVDVAADGLRRDVEMLGQRLDGDEAPLAHEIDDLRAALLLLANGPPPGDVRFDCEHDRPTEGFNSKIDAVRRSHRATPPLEQVLALGRRHRRLEAALWQRQAPATCSSEP